MGFEPNTGKIWLSAGFFLILLQLSAQSEPSFYDYLRQSGLPAGILPKGISDFSLDLTTGRFIVSLPRPCNAQFENQFHYDFNISGVLSEGQIGELSGVAQQELFLWFPVKRIRVDPQSSGLIHFDVGVVDKQFSLSLFESPRDCTAVDSEVRLIEPSQSTGPRSFSGDIQSINSPGNAERAVS